MKTLGQTLVALVLLLGPSNTIHAAPAASTTGDGDFLDRYDRTRRAATVDSVTTEIHGGLSELTRHYIRGAATPLPPAVGIDFLRLRALNSGRAELEETALGLAAAWMAINLQSYLKHGLKVDPNAAAGPTRKDAAVQSELVTVAATAYLASGKDMFSKALSLLAEDLRNWSMPGGNGSGAPPVVLDWIGVDPDTVVGNEASLDARARMAAAFMLTSAALGDPGWARLAGVVADGAREDSADDRAASTFDLALRLDARLEAAMGLGNFPGLADAAAALLARTPAADPDGGDGPEWAAYSLARYAAWAHDDRARAAALAWGDHCGAPSPPGELNMLRFRARAAEGYGLEVLARSVPMAYIVTDAAAPRGTELRMAALSSARPGRLVSCHSPDSDTLLYPASDAGPIAYVCSGELCAPPTDDPQKVKNLIDTFALPESSPGGSAGGR